MPVFNRIGHFKDVSAFKDHLTQLGIELPIDDRILSADDGSPLAQTLTIGNPIGNPIGRASGDKGATPSGQGAAELSDKSPDVSGAGGYTFTVGNRWCIHPMEGWDGTPDGKPSAHTYRRWKRFGISGAKLIWGGEALAVQYDGRANPNQLYYRPDNEPELHKLHQTLFDAHTQRFGPNAIDDLLVGLQLTHSGRYAKPRNKTRPEPRIAYHHPVLDAKVGIDPADDSLLLSDSDIQYIIANFVTAAKLAQKIGFGFVDIKHCHGYLGHELLSAYDRPGMFGGDLKGRTRFLREIIHGIRAECPGLLIGVRLSLFDGPAFHPDASKSKPGKLGPGVAHEYPPTGSVSGADAHCHTADEADAAVADQMAADQTRSPYPGFGLDRKDPSRIDLTEPLALIRLMRDDLGVDLLNLTAGSPYYNPHIQRPAFFPPSDGYQPPEDPLIGCGRQIKAVADIARELVNDVVTDAATNPGAGAGTYHLPLVGSAYTYFQEYLPHIAQAVVRKRMVDIVGLGRMVLSYPDLPADCLEAGQILKPKLLCRTFSDCTTGPRAGLISGCFPLDDYYKDSDIGKQFKAVKLRIRKQLTDDS